MSYPHWESIHSNHHVPTDHLSNGAVQKQPRHSAAADLAIDAALRGVPLPEGLLNRLNLYARRITDEATDSVDYLGC